MAPPKQSDDVTVDEVLAMREALQPCLTPMTWRVTTWKPASERNWTEKQIHALKLYLIQKDIHESMKDSERLLRIDGYLQSRLRR